MQILIFILVYKVVPGSNESPESNLSHVILMHPRCRMAYSGIQNCYFSPKIIGVFSENDHILITNDNLSKKLKLYLGNVTMECVEQPVRQ